MYWCGAHSLSRFLYFPPQQGTRKGRAICYFFIIIIIISKTCSLFLCQPYDSIYAHCIMAYIFSFDVWCAIFELPPDPSFLSEGGASDSHSDNTERNLKPCSKRSAIFKYRTVHTVHSMKDKRSCQLLINFSDTCC